jgi:hypothetical protein
VSVTTEVVGGTSADFFSGAFFCLAEEAFEADCWLVASVLLALSVLAPVLLAPGFDLDADRNWFDICQKNNQRRLERS